MTDVRLTATNPEDSSAVPVACNSRGELLITEPVIELIPNSLTVEGSLTLSDPEDETKRVHFTTGGYCDIQRVNEADGSGHIRMGEKTNAFNVRPFEGSARFKVFWDGSMQSANLRLLLEPDNSDHYVTTTRDGETVEEYNGPAIDVLEELQFLRAQVQLLMERLKMAPEGGWPVWDGSE